MSRDHGHATISTTNTNEKVQDNSNQSVQESEIIINGTETSLKRTGTWSRSSTPWRGWPKYYPSWLPRRPSPPAPPESRTDSVVPGATPVQPAVDLASEGPSSQGRRATPRSVRILSKPTPTPTKQGSGDTEKQLQHDRRSNQPRPRSTAAARFSMQSSFGRGGSQPRFRLPGLRLENLQSPSITARIRFYLLPIWVFAHLVLQTFLDFNALFILIQLTKFPSPSSVGPASSRTWALGTAAYLFCYIAQIFGIFLLYEVVYSFYRRWRTKRPLIAPLYLSSAAHNFVSMSSYSYFCFFRYIRRIPIFGDGGEELELRVWTDTLAEQFYFYAQNLPTVVSLLPRAALCLALLFTFSISGGGDNSGVAERDTTFFNGADGTLTNYAKGVLLANAAWTAWRIMVVMVSFVGLWILSGKGCAGICGPRFRWDEPEDRTERAQSVYFDVPDLEHQGLPHAVEYDPLGWEWRERTLLRIKHAWRFCLTYRGRTTNTTTATTTPGEKDEEAYESPPSSAFPLNPLDDVLESAGFPSPPTPARRRGDDNNAITSPAFFEESPPASPSRAKAKEKVKGGLSDIIPPSHTLGGKEKDRAGPLMQLPYPFAGFGAQPASPSKSVPFPSPHGEEFPEDVVGVSVERETAEDGSDKRDSAGGAASGSMSSLGQPLSSRSRGSQPRSYEYTSGGEQSQEQDQSFSDATGSFSHSQSPQSRSSGILEPISSSGSHQQHHRRRAETIPSAGGTGTGSGGSVRLRTRTISGISSRSRGSGGLGEPTPQPEPDSFLDSYDDDYEVEDEEEHAAEREDSVGLLSPRVSHQSSLAGLRRRSLSHSARGSGSNGSRSVSASSNSNNSNNPDRSFSSSGGSPVLLRSRAQSLVQAVVPSRIRVRTLSAESNNLPQGRSSVETNGSGSRSSGQMQGGYTFGRPLPWQRGELERVAAAAREEEESSAPLPPSSSATATATPSEQEREVTPQAPNLVEAADRQDDTFGRPLPTVLESSSHSGSPPASPAIAVPTRQEAQTEGEDIATAPASFVTESSMRSDTTTTGPSGAGTLRSHFTIADHHPDPTQFRSM